MATTTGDNAQGTLAATAGALIVEGTTFTAQGLTQGFPQGEISVIAGLIVLSLGVATAWIRAYLRVP